MKAKTFLIAEIGRHREEFNANKIWPGNLWRIFTEIEAHETYPFLRKLNSLSQNMAAEEMAMYIMENM